jgi:hypothetical protein
MDELTAAIGSVLPKAPVLETLDIALLQDCGHSNVRYL